LLERGSEAAVASASHARVYTLTAVMTTIEELDRRFYLGYVDEHARFDMLIRRYLQPGAAVLDVGAGRGIKYPYDYRSIVGRMAGVDIDPTVTENANLTDAAVADLASLPYAEGEFDLVFSKYVFEHLERPRPRHAGAPPGAEARRTSVDPHAEQVALRRHVRNPHADEVP
jgi:hypothetical protein